jgi:hypothetical protein
MSVGNFVVLEHLPWLEVPRIVGYFNDLKEAELEAQKLNSKSFDSNFSVGNLSYTFEIRPVITSEMFENIKRLTPSLRF